MGLRARLVALGYSRILGVDWTDKFVPVAHDVSFRIELARMMVKKLDSLVMDVETALLYGEIDEGIFINPPVGMEEIEPGSSSEDCYQLVEGIYGLPQAARQFSKKFVDTAKKEPFGFKVSPADPCWKPSSLLSNVHFRNTTKIAVQVLLLLTLFTFTFEPFLKL